MPDPQHLNVKPGEAVNVPEEEHKLAVDLTRHFPSARHAAATALLAELCDGDLRVHTPDCLVSRARAELAKQGEKP